MEHWQEGMSVCSFMLFPDLPAIRHWWDENGRCRNCGREYWESRESQMPKLSEVLQGTEATWAEQIDKESIAGQWFWIHGVRATEYQDDQGRDVSLLILHITIGDSSRKGPRAVITLGRTEEREGLLQYFSDRENDHTPIGPSITYKVNLKGGHTFWRLEDAPEEDEQPAMFSPAESGKKR